MVKWNLKKQSRQTCSLLKYMKKIYASIFTLLLFSTAFGQNWVETYQSVLNKYVTSDGVKYKKLKSNDAGTIDAIVNAIATQKASGSKEDQLAFYINAYNAWMIKIVLDRYPTDSVLNGDSKIFEKKIIKVGGVTMSLNDLEHNIIRKKFNDSRIHFAVNCGSESCPPLAKEAFTGSKLNEQLHNLTVKFINSKYGVKQSGNTLHVSQLFDWYKSDFKKDSPDGTVLGYIKKYAKVNGTPNLAFQEYSWKINED